jgi:hypothetical protein
MKLIELKKIIDKAVEYAGKIDDQAGVDNREVFFELDDSIINLSWVSQFEIVPDVVFHLTTEEGELT